MSELDDWSERTRRAQIGLAPARFLIGEWIGTGATHGAPVMGRLSVRSILDDTFLEAVETSWDEDGNVDHEDRVLYRYDIADHSLRALHIQAPAWTTDRFVDVLNEPAGIVWRGGPALPRVLIFAAPHGLTVQVWMPGDESPSSVLHYQPDPDAR